MPKDEEIDPTLLGNFLPGIVNLVDASWDIRTPPPYTPRFDIPGTSFIDNYLMYFFMPSPLEQIGTILDPFRIQEPPRRYLVNPWNLAFDVYWDAREVQSMGEPGPARVQGWPPEGYVEGAGYSTYDPNTGAVV